MVHLVHLMIGLYIDKTFKVMGAFNTDSKNNVIFNSFELNLREADCIIPNLIFNSILYIDCIPVVLYAIHCNISSIIFGSSSDNSTLRYN